MTVVPLSLREANDFVAQHHRHSKPTVGHRFSIGVVDVDDLVGVAIIGRPVSRVLDDGMTCEALRVCVQEGAPRNACSFLYRAAWRVWRAMGGTKLITYTLTSESGASLRGAAFKIVGEVAGNRQWNTPSRPRKHQAIFGQQKLRWEVS